MIPEPTYELIGDLRERLVRIETKLDADADTRRVMRTELDAHEERLGKLESNFRLLASIGAIILFLVTFFQDWITARIV